ncbi:hypothetical protein BU23DRAFT_604241 [Bimuria novae-zelandiae CBS 107.79]|uniref:Uncharacterized protein n=1 Tax=Bimuria novae-zelandiae CBS 107.79 TaxID=1447943 RepID=A0A6A5UKE5_9PLEO|nr:hypothetical protein BU23DRAFT_604241 [Bimuria novae-zelandiae CBS 107.79]
MAPLPKPDTTAAQDVKKGYTEAEIEVAEALILLSQSAPAMADKKLSRKRVRCFAIGCGHGFVSNLLGYKVTRQEFESPGSLRERCFTKSGILRPPITTKLLFESPPPPRVSSTDTALSEEEKTKSAPKPQVKKQKTFEDDRDEALESVLLCQQPLGPLFLSVSKVDSRLLNFEGYATQATEIRKRAATDPFAQTKFARSSTNTNTNTKANTSSLQRKSHKMDAFWQDLGEHDGFMQLDAPQPAFQSSEGIFDQADMNKALYTAIERLHQDVVRTTSSNQVLYEHVGALRGRVKKLEEENEELKDLLKDDSSSKTIIGKQQRQAPKLDLAISNLALNKSEPTEVFNLPPTPVLTGTTAAFPSSPATGTSATFPLNAIPSSTGALNAASAPNPSTALVIPTTPTTAGSRNALFKKDKHDLTGKLPPANTKLPLVPLTDVELIVFFYNSSSRPIIAVRLYARGGPKVIAKVINEHRIVNPDGYKRNTCSVHCNKGVKSFISMHGEGWKKKVCEYFKTANDAQATDTIRHKTEELRDTCDFPVLGLFRDLIKMPGDDQAGIFTECVRWCKDNKVDAMVSDVHLIAEALNNGIDPHELGLPLAPIDSDEEDGTVAESSKKGKGKLPVYTGAAEGSDTESDGAEDSDVESAPSTVKRKTPKSKLAQKSAVKMESPLSAKKS